MERFGQLNINGKEFPLTTDNSSLYRHLGTAALYDHVFIRLPEEFERDGERMSMYLWKTIQQTASAYELISEALTEFEDAEIHRNIRIVGEGDRRQYLKAALQDSDDYGTVPEGWL